jgi:glycosyltransferase involved in cell wall biosynthesis
MKLSVVIPVYRVEDTLERCVGSVLSQNVYDMEVILIDDGSPDRCPEMCDEWRKRDSRIRVVHKSNGGLSDARNAGIEKAEGEYITFVDSDDFIEKNTYGPLMHMIGLYADVDILEYPVFWHYGGKGQKVLSWGQHDYSGYAGYWFGTHGYEHCYACNKIYRRSLFESVRYPVGEVYEDAATTPELLAKARKIITAPQGLYYYCANKNGITSTSTGKELRMLLDNHLKVMQNKCFLEDIRYYMHVLNIQLDVYEFTRQPPLLPSPSFGITAVLRPMPVKLRFKAFLLILLGIQRLCKLNTLIHQILRQ